MSTKTNYAFTDTKVKGNEDSETINTLHTIMMRYEWVVNRNGNETVDDI